MTALTVLTALAPAQGGPAMPDATRAGEANPRFGRVELETGIHMHVAEMGDAAGVPIILLHGYSDSWFSFSRVLPLLGDRYRLYALDLRGHGNSDRPASGYLMRDLAEDVVAFMDAKRIARATIIGHSMGSFVAQQVAIAAPRRVSRLVLIGSVTEPRKFGDFMALKAAVETLPEPVPYEFARDFQVSTIHKGVSDAFLKRAIAESLKMPARVWRELMKGMLATEPALALGRTQIPTLVVQGEKDTYAIRSEQDALVALIRTAKLKIYRDTGHALHWERPRQFARDLRAFMAWTSQAANQVSAN
jgi:pimeloyl-ACP methyl ester carboxylesterase